MNIEETKKYIERRLSDLGWSVRIDKAGFQTIQKYSGGDKERLNHLYYKMVSVGSRQDRREINSDTIQVAIDDLRRMDEIVENAPLNLGHNNRNDFDRVTIEQLASSLERTVAEEIESEVVAAGKQAANKKADPAIKGNGQTQLSSASVSAAVAADGEPRKPRILVVDDSPTIRAAVTKALENDFEFVEASDGEKAWKLLRANTDIRLIVTDLMMPKMDGYDLIKRIRSAKTDTWITTLPIIVVTALEDTQAKLRALVSGANDFITKTTDTLELQARVVARYQLAQAVGKTERAANDATAPSASSSAATQIGPPPRQVAAAMLGGRAPTIVKESVRMESVVRPQGSGSGASKTGAAVTQIHVPPRLAANKSQGTRTPSAAKAMLERVVAVSRTWYRHLERLDPTTGITLLASFLVIVTIVGVIYVNRAQTKAAARAGETIEVASVSPEQAGEPVPQATEVASDNPPVVEAPRIAEEKKNAEPVTAPAATAPPRVESRRQAQETKQPPPRKEARETAAAKTAVIKETPVERPTSTPSTASRVPTAEVGASAAGATGTSATAANASETLTAPESTETSQDAPSESSTVVAQAPSAAVAPASSVQLSQSELSTLMKKFVFVYQAGDIEQFLSLFDDAVRTNERFTKSGLREDYEGLFRSTSMRQMNLGNVAWEINNRQAQGWSNFEVRVRNTGEEEVKTYRGSLTFHVEKSPDGRVRITRMYHGQWRATN